MLLQIPEIGVQILAVWNWAFTGNVNIVWFSQYIQFLVLPKLAILCSGSIFVHQLSLFSDIVSGMQCAVASIFHSCTIHIIFKHLLRCLKLVVFVQQTGQLHVPLLVWHNHHPCELPHCSVIGSRTIVLLKMVAFLCIMAASARKIMSIKSGCFMSQLLGLFCCYTCEEIAAKILTTNGLCLLSLFMVSTDSYMWLEI